MAVTSMIGARIQRREDPKLITGHGNFIDDVNLVNMAHMSVVRSPHAHARIRSIDTAAALAAKGVVAVLTAADFKGVILGPLPVTNSFVADKKQVPEQFPIAAEEAADWAGVEALNGIKSGPDGDDQLIGFARKLSRQPWRMGEGDLERLRSLGYSDEAVLHVISVVAHQNADSRLVLGLGAIG